MELSVALVEEDVGSAQDILDPVGLAELGGNDILAGVDARRDARHVSSVIEPRVLEGEGEVPLHFLARGFLIRCHPQR